LETELSDKKYTTHLRKKYGGIFGESGHKFHESAESGDILNVASQALSRGEIPSSTLRRKYIVNPDKPLKKVQYKGK
jgi:hypothetical protein